jgi:Transglutaminase-like superfamily
MKTLAKLMALPAQDRSLLFKSLAPMLAMRLGLWTMPYTQARVVADRMARFRVCTRIGDAAAKPSPEKIAWAVATVSRVVPGGGNCLVRAMATEILLKRYGYASTLKIGVAKPAAGQFAAHAWLESDGVVVIGDFQLDRFVPLSQPDRPAG